MSFIFGHSGIVNSDNLLSYDSKLANLDSFIRNFPNFQNYLETQLKPPTTKTSFRTFTNRNCEEQWTNNNSESMNNRLKQSLDWKPHKLPDLVTKINEISSFQMNSSIQRNDPCRAIHGNGNCIMENTLKHHRVQPDVWVKMSQSEKREKTWKLLYQKPIDAEKSRFIKSSRCSFQVNIHYMIIFFSMTLIFHLFFKYIFYSFLINNTQVPPTSNVAKKPCQRKRSRAERTSY